MFFHIGLLQIYIFYISNLLSKNHSIFYQPLKTSDLQILLSDQNMNKNIQKLIYSKRLMGDIRLQHRLVS